MKPVYADLSLLITAVIWGTGFPATFYALQSGFSTSFILLIRFSVAAAILAIGLHRRIMAMSRPDFIRGLITGIFLFLAFYTQTFALRFTTPSNNAFITATNVIMVPFMTWLLFRKRPHRKFFILPFVTFIGVAILTYRPGVGFHFSTGDTFTLLCAFFFALHISYLDTVTKQSDPALLTFLQMATASVLSLLYFITIDYGVVGTDILWSRGLLWSLYLGLFSTLIAFFLQTSAQKYTTSTKTAIFLSSESLFGSLFSVLLAIEPYSVFMVSGGAVILVSIILSEVNIRFPKPAERHKHTM